MQSSSPRLPFLFRSGLVLLTVGLFAACDQHPKGEPGEGYGHGSSHAKSYQDHSIDSTKGSEHFSDTRGTEPKEKTEAEPSVAPAVTPEKRFNP